MAALTLCYGRGKEVGICYCPMLDLTSIVQLTVALAVLLLRGGSGLPLFCFLIQLGTQKFLIFLFDKTLRITEFRI